MKRAAKAATLLRSDPAAIAEACEFSKAETPQHRFRSLNLHSTRKIGVVGRRPRPGNRQGGMRRVGTTRRDVFYRLSRIG